MRPPGFLQVDADGLWAVRACYRRPENSSFEDDPCWQEGLPRLAGTFDRIGTPASFFIVGRDLTVESKSRLARKLLHQGFELGNHTWNHHIGITARPYGYLLKEMRRTDRELRKLGAEPVGFRAPGYDVDARVVRAVRQCGYLYDASLLPTPLGPVLRLADAWMARRWQPGKRQFGRIAYARAPRTPYFPLRHKLRKPDPHATTGLMELPVGTTPYLHLPLTAASLFSRSRASLRSLFSTLAKRKAPVMLLLHAIDGVDCRQPIVFDNRRTALGGFDLSGREKERRLRLIVSEFARHFDVVRADEYVRQHLESTS